MDLGHLNIAESYILLYPYEEGEVEPVAASKEVEMVVAASSIDRAPNDTILF